MNQLSNLSVEPLPSNLIAPEISVSVIGDTPVLTTYAQRMVDYAAEYQNTVALFNEPDEEPAEEQSSGDSSSSSSGTEDPAHHNGSPAGYPDGSD